MKKSNKEHQKNHREKMKALGYKPVLYWVLPEWKVKLKELLKQLRKQ